MNKAAQEFKTNAVAQLVASWKERKEPLPCFAAFEDAMRNKAYILAAQAALKGHAISKAKSMPVNGTAYIFMRDAYANLVKEQQ